MGNKVSFIIQLKDQFGRTASKINRQFEKIKRNANKASNSIRDFTLRAQASLKKVGAQATKTGALMTAGLTTPILLMGRRMIDTASDAQETADKFKVMFEEVNGAGDSVKRLADKYKLANSTSQELLASTGAIISASGMNKNRVLELSEAVGGLSIDLASMHNFTGSAADATMILSKALLGEAESLKTNFGITILQNKEFQQAVKQKMRLTGVTKQAAKAEVIYAEILKQATAQKAIDNFNLTLGSYANQQRVAAEASKQMSESFGVLLLPIATKVMQTFTKLTKRINNMSPGMKTLVLILAGVVAIGGPLLLLFGAIALAVAAITLPVLAIGGAIAAVVVAVGLLAARWKDVVGGAKLLWSDFTDFIGNSVDKIGVFFSNMWSGVKAGFVSFINFGIEALNALLGPLSFVSEKLGLGSISVTPIAAPTAPVQGANGTLEGNITVSAAAGSEVKETSLSTSGSGLNLGMNMVTQ